MKILSIFIFIICLISCSDIPEFPQLETLDKTSTQAFGVEFPIYNSKNQLIGNIKASKVLISEDKIVFDNATIVTLNNGEKIIIVCNRCFFFKKLNVLSFEGNIDIKSNDSEIVGNNGFIDLSKNSLRNIENPLIKFF